MLNIKPKTTNSPKSGVRPLITWMIGFKLFAIHLSFAYRQIAYPMLVA